MHYTYVTQGTCSRAIDFDLSEDNIVSNVEYTAGCNGNLKALGILTEGLPAEVVIEKLAGLTCKTKPTSCGDQLARALKEATQRAETDKDATLIEENAPQE